jgi:hypothetical protein
VTAPDLPPGPARDRWIELDARQSELIAQMRDLEPADGEEPTPEQSLRWLRAAGESAMVTVEQEQLLGREPGGEDDGWDDRN